MTPAPVVSVREERVEHPAPIKETPRYIIRGIKPDGGSRLTEQTTLEGARAIAKNMRGVDYVSIFDTRPHLSPPAQAPHGGAVPVEVVEAIRNVARAYDDDTTNWPKIRAWLSSLAQKPEAREVPEAAIKYAIDILDLREDTLRRGPNGQDAESNADYARGMADELRAFLGGDGAKGGG